ncbi:MAC/perforin domain-containing protein [Sulfurospirillum deleyianum]|uniref:Membrane attack complex component/perforin/complement C9 n=1 Tax=Sulfurospirillum deleyianum (strain ATCC 51133 / DSM 6946 / 5175) TaxID=525898 RepID=D1B2B8_SULD5|nr:MAC/perforin domain-containing protein [Sulfurospirillum deleyianum]ACZ12238.1 membrane attack complex component/perforin/complement C9 [Sulfurospirillum deleyianum DSM 6946]
MGEVLQTVASRDMVLPNASKLVETAFLGYGYDVTGLYCHPNGVRANVIDMPRLLEEKPERFEKKIGTSSDTKVVVAENAMEYCSKLTAKLAVDASYKKVFSGALSLKFDYANSCSSKYSFGSFFLIMRKASLSLVVDANDLKPYVKAQFLEDVQTKSCETLIRLYGTHLMSNITLGGRLEVLCRSIVEDERKEYSIEVGVKASVKKIVNVSSELSYDESVVSKNKELTVNIETIGGDPSKCMIDSFDYTKASSELKSDFSAWQNSLNDENMTLVDMAKGSLISIADLIPNDAVYASKKEALVLAIDRYLQENQFSMVDAPKPLYRYFSPYMDDHFYTMNWNELKFGNGNYSFERIECLIYDLKVPHSIPLYRYYSEQEGDHLYSTRWSELKNGDKGYVFEGICGYVFPDASSDKRLVPLHRYVHVGKTRGKEMRMDHFYTLNPSDVAGGGWIDEGVIGYVLPPLKD